MLGYNTESKAIKYGATHHGSYYGIPIWIGNVQSDGPLVFAKWRPFDLLILIASVIEGVVFPFVYGPDAQPMFFLKVKAKINKLEQE